MDLEGSPPADASGAAVCSICLDPVLGRGGGRSVAKLQCGHEFHLDCIGSAFNAKGAMQCPNCRKIEKGHWLYANGHRPSPDIDMGGWVIGEAYDITSDLPFGFQWCSFSGFTQLAAVFEKQQLEIQKLQAEPNLSSKCLLSKDNIERSVKLNQLRITQLITPSAASSSLVCPYLSLLGFLHPMLPSRSGAESTSFHQHSTGAEGHAASDMSDSQDFHTTESRNRDTEHQYLSSLPVSGIPDHSVTPFGIGLPRYDSSSQQRSRPFAHPPPLIRRPIPCSGSNLVAPLGSVVADTRGHGHGAGGHMYYQSMRSMQSSPFPPTTRRVRPRALAITSFIAAASSAEVGRPHVFSAAPGAVNRSVPDAEGVSGLVRGGKRGLPPFPWIPAEGDFHWWSTFSPMQNHAPGSFSRAPGHVGERVQ